VHDASRVGIGVVLTKLERLLAYLSGTLGGLKLKYSTFDKEFYTIIRALSHWNN